MRNRGALVKSKRVLMLLGVIGPEARRAHSNHLGGQGSKDIAEG